MKNDKDIPFAYYEDCSDSRLEYICEGWYWDVKFEYRGFSPLISNKIVHYKSAPYAYNRYPWSELPKEVQIFISLKRLAGYDGFAF